MTRDRSLDVAITGIAARLPGVDSLEGFRSSVLGGRTLIGRLSERELLQEGVSALTWHQEGYVPYCAYLDDAYRFDHAFFGFSERDALLSDPQHRLSLEVAWQALEDSTMLASRTSVTTSVFSCSSPSVHARRLLAAGRHDSYDIEQILMYSERDFLATSLAYKLNLTGQALTVLSACSSSLVAVHMAAGALNSGECDQAVVTAASIASPQGGHFFTPGGIMSRTGRCRPFDACADGTVSGSGAAAIVLRRYDDAIQGGEPIHGVILGSAVNNDGADKPGFTSPSVRGQSRVIAAALRAADIEAGTVGYLETHGTGTAIGDPLEWRAAQETYGALGAAERSIALGAVKGTVGHLDVAAGLVGLISAVQTLKDRVIPPVCGLDQPNPLLEPSQGPLYLPNSMIDDATRVPKRAGVTSLGVGGTNVHVLLEGPPDPAPSARVDADGTRSVHVIPVSARDREALALSSDALNRWVSRLGTESDRVADLAFTQSVGREVFPERTVILARFDPERQVQTLPAVRADGSPRPVILFPGQGTQRPGMAASALNVLPSFSERLDEAVDAFGPILGQRVRHALLDVTFSRVELRRTELAQPALFAFEYAHALALRDVGVRPVALVGHSVGEITAACVAGVLDLASAARLVAVRGAAMGACEPGMMVALACGESLIRDFMRSKHPQVSVAAVNSSESVVVAGPIGAIKALLSELGQDVMATVLRTNHAFHTPAMASAAARLREALLGLTLAPPSITIGSNLTGELIPVGGEYPLELLVGQIVQPVRFADLLNQLDLRFPTVPALEVGPGTVLSSLAESSGRQTIPLAASAGDDPWAAIARIWAAGVHIDISAFSSGRRVHAPVYPFRGPVLRPDFPMNEQGGVTAPSGSGTELERDEQEDSPEDSVADIVADAWARQLGAREWTGTDNFIELGGDSLAAVRLARDLSNVLGLTIPVHKLLAEATFASHALIVEARLIESLGEE